MNASPTPSRRKRLRGGLWGSIVGDALGVPVEFQDYAILRANPVTDMPSGGTHRQPSGCEECVLKAVNLGGDTDTTGCAAGGLAGVHCGVDNVPEKGRRSVWRQDKVASLFNRFAAMLPERP